MGSPCYVNSMYGSMFSQENISSHFQTTDTTNVNAFFNTGNIMLPSPEYGPKELNACTPFRNSQQPLQTQQEDTASMFYQAQMPTSLIKTEDVSLSIYPQNEYKPEVSVFIYMCAF
jgi:hypothetical protein